MLRFGRLTFIAVLAFATVAFAQHGGHGAGMGAGGGMGADHGMSGSHDMGPNGSAANTSHGSSIGSQSPDSVLGHNKAIAAKIKDLTGQDASTACSGFKNLGQCVAAAHVAKNLPGLSFDSLKAKMTGSSPESLGKAIQDLQPTANSKKEAKKAQNQANQDLQQSGS